MNRKRFGTESNVIYRNKSNSPAKGAQTGGRAGGAVCEEVAIQIHPTNKYRRTLADVLLSDGTNVNHKLVKDGWCRWYRKYASGDTVREHLEHET